MAEKIKKTIASRHFLYLALSIFTLQAIFFAAAVKYKIPPDEKSHFMFAQYYADQPLHAGPLITHQQGNFVLGDIQRTPSYLYQYLMSFPLRVFRHISSDLQAQVFMLRLVNVALGVITLLILARLLKKIKVSAAITNLVLGMVALTSMFVWMFGAVNYDNLAIPLFLLFVLFMVDFIQSKTLTALLSSTLVAMALALTKFTYVPAILFGYLAVFIINYGHVRTLYRSVKKSINWPSHKILLILLVAANLLFIGLIVERYGINAIKYHSFTPTCTKIHTMDECLQTPNFARNQQQAAVFKQFKAQGSQLPFAPIEFAGHWIELMYERIFFFFGHKYIVANRAAKYLAGLTLATILTMFVLSRTAILRTIELKFVAAITTFYIILLFLFNAHSYLSTGAEFGFQGRYLLPVIPFIYLFILLVVKKFIVNYKGVTRQILTIFIGLLILANLYVHMPLLVFLRGTDNVWYTSKTIQLNNDLKDVLGKAKLLHWKLTYSQ